MLLFNESALIGLFAGLVGWGAAASFGLSRSLSILFGIAVAGATDLYVRYKSHDVEGAIWHPNAGGHLWFIPVWIWSLVAAVVSVLVMMGWLSWI